MDNATTPESREKDPPWPTSSEPYICAATLMAQSFYGTHHATTSENEELMIF